MNERGKCWIICVPWVARSPSYAPLLSYRHSFMLLSFRYEAFGPSRSAQPEASLPPAARIDNERRRRDMEGRE